jgi:hypothetical protein
MSIGRNSHIIVCYTRCYSCMFGSHFEPKQAHSWMEQEDAEHAGHAWPLTPEVEAANLCPCSCGEVPQP